MSYGECVMCEEPLRMNGWVNRGRLTKAGLEIAHKAMKPTPWEISVLPPQKRSIDR